MTCKLKAIDRHRNGVGGAPFHAVLFTCKEDGNDTRFMLATVFDEPGVLAVLATAQTAAGNIAFGEGNSWRGDRYEPWLRRQIKEWEASR